MARLIVGKGDVEMDFGSLTLQTLEFTAEPAMDPTGRDLECVRYTLEFTGIVNAVAIATRKSIPGSVGMETRGDILPGTMINFKEFLMKPRQYFQFSVNDQVVLESPAKSEHDGQIMECDAQGGPYPQRASYTRFTGEKSAVLHWRVVTYQSDCPRYCTSLRYSITQSINQYQLTTYTVRGRAAFRKDALVDDPDGELYPDDFRKWLIIPTPGGCRRTHLDVTQNAEGDEVNFTCVDSEIIFGTGDSNDIVQVSGSITASADTPIKDLAGAGVALFDVNRSLMAMDFIGIMGKVWGIAVPSNRNMGIVRVTGRKGADRKRLANTAMKIVTDRFRPMFTGKICIAMASFTHNIDSEYCPYAEVRLSFLTGLAGIAEIRENLNTTDSIFGTTKEGKATAGGPDGGEAIFSPLTAASRLPGGNVRGTLLVRMVSQALLPAEDVCDAPTAPAATTPAVDTVGLT